MDDMLTRWAVQTNQSVPAAKVLQAKSLICAPINPSIDSKLDWPSLSDIKKSQASAKVKPPKSFNQTDEGLKIQTVRVGFLQKMT